MSVTGERDDLPGGGPQKVGVAVADLFTGMCHRRDPGRAPDSTCRAADSDGPGPARYPGGMRAPTWPLHLVIAEAPAAPATRTTNVRTRSPPSPTVTCRRRRQQSPVRALQGDRSPEVAQDERFVRNADRVRHRDRLIPLLAERLLARKRRTGGRVRRRHGAVRPNQRPGRGLRRPAGPRSPDGHPRATPAQRCARTRRQPDKLSATPVRVRRPPPLLGQHTDEVLAEIGVDAVERDRLRALKVIGPPG